MTKSQLSLFTGAVKEKEEMKVRVRKKYENYNSGRRSLRGKICVFKYNTEYTDIYYFQISKVDQLK